MMPQPVRYQEQLADGGFETKKHAETHEPVVPPEFLTRDSSAV